MRALYARLLDDAAHYPDTMDERRGAWARLLALFRLVHHGDSARLDPRPRRQAVRSGRLPFPARPGQGTDQPAPAAVSDGCILRILDLLITARRRASVLPHARRRADRQRLRDGDGLHRRDAAGPGARDQGRQERPHAGLRRPRGAGGDKGAEREKYLKEEADRNALSDKVAKALAAATGAADVIAALRPIVDERGSPGGHVSPPGTPLLQPTDERRRTGSHYTPRSLTEPIVQPRAGAGLRAASARTRKPEDVLALKVCDPAMGSGAFLVEACRALGERLVRAWARWPETRPKIPTDEDEQLHARRLVAQRCLYGVDKNPRAVELAKLSLWLATLARDHEFTFLDHALKCGDSLVGLDATADRGDALGHYRSPACRCFAISWRSASPKAMKARAEIQSRAGRHDARHAGGEARSVEGVIERTCACWVTRYLAPSSQRTKPKRARNDAPRSRAGSRRDTSRSGTSCAAARSDLSSGRPPAAPFHWEIEFPEVFARENGGLRCHRWKSAISWRHPDLDQYRDNYLAWLMFTHPNSHGNSDLSAHFFRRAYCLLRKRGVFGLVATNTIGQGDTRTSGLERDSI